MLRDDECRRAKPRDDVSHMRASLAGSLRDLRPVAQHVDVQRVSDPDEVTRQHMHIAQQ